jgi:predicted phosphoribosyltransferase
MSDYSWVLGPAPLFSDRREAGRSLAGLLAGEVEEGAVVVGLARGGVVVAAEAARALGLPLDAVAVRKIGHPRQPEYAIGAVAPGDGVYVRAADGLTVEQLRAAAAAAKAQAAALDRRLHAEQPPLDLTGRPCILVDDGLATGATMIAAVRWARARGASRVVAAGPVGAGETVELLRWEADRVVCPHALDAFLAVGCWYDEFDQVEDKDVLRLLADSRRVAETSTRLTRALVRRRGCPLAQAEREARRLTSRASGRARPPGSVVRSGPPRLADGTARAAGRASVWVSRTGIGAPRRSASWVGDIVAPGPPRESGKATSSRRATTGSPGVRSRLGAAHGFSGRAIRALPDARATRPGDIRDRGGHDARLHGGMGVVRRGARGDDVRDRGSRRRHARRGTQPTASGQHT